MKNPPSTKPSDFVQIKLRLRDFISNEYFEVDQNLDQIKITANTPNTLNSARVKRSNVQVSLETTLTVCFSPVNPVPARALLTLEIPKD